MRNKVEPYDKAVEDALVLHGKVYNEFRVWCFKSDIPYDQSHLSAYLDQMGLDAMVITVGHKRWRWTINGIEYVNYSYRVSRNAHYSAIFKALQIREEELSS